MSQTQGAAAYTGMPNAEESWQVSGGARVTLRAVRHTDRAGLRAFIDGLSLESRYYRYLTGGRVADTIIESFIGYRPDRDVAVVLTSPSPDGEETIIGKAEYVVNAEGVADLAVVVADGWQGKGLGRRLIQRLQNIARTRKLRGMRGDVLSENRRMLAIMRECGFSARRNPEDSFLHEVSLTLGAPAPAHPGRLTPQWLPADWFAAN
ncbi:MULTISPECIES: GNAT family N-acetyltransferase [unclassified Cupriavidus]|uniref:GNAT family N-acetyltransferase n=1 Tax=unclassified Cupriavidus TaxID=2640874 RepID=UPI0010F4B483|nr:MULTISPECIES: GNAT family N-acetyltransferase [unclassified Cupriavidus]MWL90081.1 GNAT family N-acetyltransferase [Cupriavidus sp. SW-Y-13]